MAAVNNVSGNSKLEAYFRAVLEKKTVNVDRETVFQLLQDEFEMEVSSMGYRLQEVLPYLFAYYLKSWPGWQKFHEYNNGILTFMQWYNRFKQYLQLKLNNIVQNTFKKAVEECEREDSKCKVSEIAPFKIKITGPPSLLNTIIFVTVDDDAVIKQHVGPNLSSISVQQLVNWPLIEIELSSPEFTFTRKNATCVDRYLSGTSEKIKFPSTSFIEEATIVDLKIKPEVLSHEFLKAYCDKTLSFIKRNANSPPSCYAEILETLFNEFLEDIVELEVNKTIATNTKVLFNIGGCKYVRSKKVKAGPSQNEALIKYFEIITPKVELYIKELKTTPFKKPDGTIDFTLGEYKQTSLPILTYRCTYCDKSYTTFTQICQHLQKTHGMEQVLYCLKCHRRHEVTTLSLTRWKHKCL